MSYRIRIKRARGKRFLVPRFSLNNETRIRLAGGRELLETVARKNPVFNGVMTAKDVAGSAYKLTYGKNPPSITRLVYNRLGLAHPHPPGCMCPYHGGHKKKASIPAMRGIGRKRV